MSTNVPNAPTITRIPHRVRALRQSTASPYPTSTDLNANFLFVPGHVGESFEPPTRDAS